MSPATAVTAQELTARDQVNVGVSGSAAPQLRTSAEEEKALKVEPSQRFEYADHVANGIAMRNRTAGTIHLRGAPVPSKVLAGLLYVNFSDETREGRREFPVLFNNTVVSRPKRQITTILAGGWRATTPIWPTSLRSCRSEGI
jgi:hypothetical protein